MERLSVHQIRDILYRLKRGQSERAIACDLGLSRDAVHRYRVFGAAQGFLAPQADLPEETTLQQILGPKPLPPRQVSTLEPYRDLVKQWLEDGKERMVIHQRLVSHHGYTGSYTSVRRFVNTIQPKAPDVVLRVETPPGQEAQVDFGGAGKMRDPSTGKLRVAYAFVMTLSCSRHMYVEFVFDQKMSTWIRCHRNAFSFFGGCPKEIVIDNLKAAVIKHAIEDPQLSLPYTQMAQHYGFLIHPCRPRTPKHKGKVESGVHYVQRNLLASYDFDQMDLTAANEKAKDWCLHHAGTRDHGTTHEPPIKRFEEKEKAALLPLPAEPFELHTVVSAKVHRDIHIVVDGSFYSVPHPYAGKQVDAYVYERTLQVYDGVVLLTTHPRATARGQRLTRMEHYPEHRARYLERTPDVCKELAQDIGPACSEVVKHLFSQRPADNLRAAQALLSLAEKVGTKRLEAACERALFFGDPHYRRVKGILNAGLDADPLPGQETPLAPPRAFTHARPVSEFFEEREVATC
jgi:transposase